MTKVAGLVGLEDDRDLPGLLGDGFRVHEPVGQLLVQLPGEVLSGGPRVGHIAHASRAAERGQAAIGTRSSL